MELAALLEGVRRLGLAATRSVAAVREELDRALRAAAPAIDCVLVFDEEDGALRCTFASGARVMYFHGVEIACGDAKTLPSLALACGHRVALGTDGVRGFHPTDAFALAVPIERSAGRKSVVYCAAAQRVEPGLAEQIVLLIDHAGFAYTRAHEREAHQQRAEFDALTGLLSPRALRERLAALIERARFVPLARIALLFVDTDHFKAWNDTHGHASGDALLRALARVLRTAAGPDDLVARNGGDEFCLVFTDTEKSRAVERAETLRGAVQAMTTAELQPSSRESGPAITASIGVAAYPADCSTPHALLERADEAMYHSKRSGRNAVSYAGVDGVLICAAERTRARM